MFSHLRNGLFLVLLLAKIASALNYTYIGPPNGLWSNPTNWNPNGVPGMISPGNDNIFFTSGVSSTCDINQGHHSVYVQDSSTIRITAPRGVGWYSYTTSGLNSPTLMCSAATSTCDFNYLLISATTTIVNCQILSDFTIANTLYLFDSSITCGIIRGGMVPFQPNIILASIYGNGTISRLNGFNDVEIFIENAALIQTKVRGNLKIASSTIFTNEVTFFAIGNRKKSLIQSGASPIFHGIIMIYGELVNLGTPIIHNRIDVLSSSDIPSLKSLFNLSSSYTCPPPCSSGIVLSGGSMLVRGSIRVKNSISIGSGATAGVQSKLLTEGLPIFDGDVEFRSNSLAPIDLTLEILSGNPAFNGKIECNRDFESFPSARILLKQNGNTITVNGGASFYSPLDLSGNFDGTGVITVKRNVMITIGAIVTVSNDIHVLSMGSIYVPPNLMFASRGNITISSQAQVDCAGSCSFSSGTLYGSFIGAGSWSFLGKFLILGRLPTVGTITVQSGELTLSTETVSISSPIVTTGTGRLVTTVSATFLSPLIFSGTGTSVLRSGSPSFSGLVTIDGGSLTNSGAFVTFVVGMTITESGGAFRLESGAISGQKINCMGGTLFINGSDTVPNPILIDGKDATFISEGSGTFFQVSILRTASSLILSGSPTFKSLTITSNLTISQRVVIDGLCTLSNTGIVTGPGTIAVSNAGFLRISTNAVISSPITTEGNGHIELSGSATFLGRISLSGFGKSEIRVSASPTFRNTVDIGPETTLAIFGDSANFMNMVNVFGTLALNDGILNGQGNIVITGRMKILPSNSLVTNPINMTSNVLECLDQSTQFSSLITNINICATRGNCLPASVCANCTNGFSPCEISCFGISSSSPTVCSGFGTCQSHDMCKCSPDYAGAQCQFPICFGIPSSLNSSCSGNGKCLTPDKCQCDCGWTEKSCSLPICFNIIANETDVCSGHGQCSLPNVCLCFPGWHGPKCETFNCFGRETTSNEVCGNKNGECVAANTCKCRGDFSGPQCSDFMCNNIQSTDTNNTLLCNGQGSCVGPNKCNCNFSRLMIGQNCDNPLVWVLLAWLLTLISFLIMFPLIILSDFLLFLVGICGGAKQQTWNHYSSKSGSKKQGKLNTKSQDRAEELLDLKKPLLDEKIN